MALDFPYYSFPSLFLLTLMRGEGNTRVCAAQQPAKLAYGTQNRLDRWALRLCAGPGTPPARSLATSHPSSGTHTEGLSRRSITDARPGDGGNRQGCPSGSHAVLRDRTRDRTWELRAVSEFQETGRRNAWPRRSFWLPVLPDQE